MAATKRARTRHVLSRGSSRAREWIGETAEIMKKLEADAGFPVGRGEELVADRIFSIPNGDLIAALEVAVVAQRMWLADLETIAKEMRVIPLQLDDRTCGFGRFYHSINSTSPKTAEIWKRMGEDHLEVHAKARLVIAAVQRGDRQAAEAAAREAACLSHRILSGLRELRILAKEIESSCRNMGSR